MSNKRKRYKFFCTLLRKGNLKGILFMMNGIVIYFITSASVQVHQLPGGGTAIYGLYRYVPL